MKNILIILLITISANAYDCSTKSSNGMIYKTMFETYKDYGNEKVMWFKFEKIAQGKIISHGKQKIETQSYKFRVLQSITYDKNNHIIESYNNGHYSEFEDPIPETMGLWMMNMTNAGGYLQEIKHVSIQKDICKLYGQGFIPADENGTIIPPFIQ